MFQQNSIAEAWFTQHGISFVYTIDIEYVRLTPDWNKINEGRPANQPVDEGLCENYASSMQAGAVFPAPIIAPTGAGFEPLDGCQRLTAGELIGATRFNAYVLADLSPDIRERIRKCANNILNGKRESEEFTVKQIVDSLYQRQRLSVEECALWSGLNKKVIEREVAARSGQRLLQTIGVDTTIKPANQKGFQAVFSKAFPSVFLKAAPDDIRDVVRKLQRIKATNGEANTILDRYAGLKPKKDGTTPSTQIKSVTNTWTSESDYARRMAGKASSHPVDKAITGLRSAHTMLNDCANPQNTRKVYTADKQQADNIIELLGKIRTLARKIVPREYWHSQSDIIV